MSNSNSEESEIELNGDKITLSLQFLSENTKNLPLLMGYLIGAGVATVEHKQNAMSKEGDVDQARSFFREIQSEMNNENYEKFMSSLAETENEVLVEYLEALVKEQEDEVHIGVTCDGCKLENIVGFRYKCDDCEDFDFCGECFEDKKHHHLSKWTVKETQKRRQAKKENERAEARDDENESPEETNDDDGNDNDHDDADDRYKEYQIIARDSHNEYRRKHHAPDLVLDETLCANAEKSAQYYCQRRTIDHSSPYKDGAGENLACGSGDREEKEFAGTSCKMWYDEVSSYNYAYGGFSMETGHFTQVVWKDSTKFGFGYCAQNGYTVTVGLYSPHGNFQGQFQQNVFPP